MDLKGRIALITGSARGIGKSIALTLAKHGASIIINDIEPMKEEAEKTVEEIKALGVESYFVAGDVSNFESCQKLAEAVKEKSQKVDILINNAGITKDRTLKKMTPEEWNAVINVNLTGIYNVTHNVLPLIPQMGTGRIINIASVVGITGNFGQANYSATKAGAITFSKTLAKEVGRSQITVNAIAPGFIKTPMTEKIPLVTKQMMKQIIALGEFGEPQDVANAAAFLASDEASYISGSVINVDGGMLR